MTNLQVKYRTLVQNIVFVIIFNERNLYSVPFISCVQNHTNLITNYDRIANF